MGINKTGSQPTTAAELCSRAEERVSVNSAKRHLPRTMLETQSLVHELEVYQIELKMQNAELLLAQSEEEKALEQYQYLYDYAPIGYFSFDCNGNIQKVNLTGAGMLKIERSLLIGRRFQQYLTNEARATFSDFLERVFQATIRQTCEVELSPEGGQPVFVRIDAESFDQGQLCLAAVTDITEQKNLTQALAEKDILRTLVQTIPDLIWLKDENGVYLFCNPMFERFFGAPEADIIGKTDYDFVNRELADLFRENDLKAMAAGKPSSNEEEITFADDGHHAFLETIKTPMFNAGGKLIGVLGVARDITEKKTLGAQLFQSQKMEAIGQLAGGIAHDFNNILTGIIGFSNLIEMHMDKDDPQRENLNHVLAGADRAAELTKSLLAFSRKQIINPQPIDLNQILNKTEKFLKRVIGEDIALKMITHQDVLLVHADSGQIEQVLMNLATNARDAMSHGGTLSIESSSVEINADFIKAHGYGEPGEYALVSISDNGMGMDGITCKRLFEPFFTTKALGKGTGLGLSIVYGIVKQHNGYIIVYSEQDVGTTFTIYLPLLKEKALLSINPVEEVLKGGTETILLADDDAVVRSLVEKVLNQFGYSVINANDGLDAVDKFSRNRDRISLVILDVIMPNMNGKEALDEILKISPDMKALFISGYTADIIHKRGTLDESLEFLSKPLRPMNLLRKVREVLDGTKPNENSRVNS